MKNLKLYIITICSIILTSSCAILEQFIQISQLSKCNFKIQNTQDLKIAGISMQNKQSFSDFSITDAFLLTRTLISDNIPAEITINIKATNPNTQTAGMNKLAWGLSLDQTHITDGVINQTVTIPPNESTIIPMTVSFNLRELFNGKNKSSFMNLVKNLTGNSDSPSEVALKLVPSIKVGESFIDYPGDLIVKHKISSNKQ